MWIAAHNWLPLRQGDFLLSSFDKQQKIKLGSVNEVKEGEGGWEWGGLT